MKIIDFIWEIIGSLVVGLIATFLYNWQVGFGVFVGLILGVFYYNKFCNKFKKK